jgi:trimeric autotransporter adhesin
MKLRVGCVVVGFLLLGLSLTAQTESSAASSQVPPLIQFSNVATDEAGNTLSGVVSITFSLYAAQQGGAPLWTETQKNIQLDATGHYSVQLGITQPNGVPTTLFTSGEARWLGVRVAEQGEQPRVLLLSVPYALKAGDAATIGGLPPSAFVLAAPGSSSALTTFVAAASSDNPAGAPAATDVTGLGTVNFIPLWTSTSNIANSVLFQSAASPFKIGINTATPATTLDVKGAGTIRGTLALPPTGLATAAKGANSQPLNLVASVFNTTAAVNQTFEWQAEPAGNNTAAASGTLNLLFAAGATKPAETGLHIASNGLITFAAGQTFPGGGGSGTVTSVATGLGLKGGPITTSGTLTIDTTVVPQLGAVNTFTGNQTVNGGTITANSNGSSIVGNTTSTASFVPGVTGNGINMGLYGAATSTFGIGVYGDASASTGFTYGVYGTTASTSGVGVGGAVPASSGTTYGVTGGANSPSGFGVFGTNSATSGNAVGVYGASSSTTGYGIVGLQGGAGVASGVPAGVYGVTGSSAGYGVEGTSPGIGVYGTGIVGVDGITSSTAGIGVNGIASATTGNTYGVHGQSQSPGGYGVFGQQFASSGNTAGVYGTTSSSFGFGVEGQSPYTGVYGVSNAPSSAGQDIFLAAGLWGDSNELAGILGTADGGYGGYFLNDGSSSPTLVVDNQTTTVGAELFNAFMPNLLTNSSAIIGDPGCAESNGNMGLQLGQLGMSGCTNYTLLGNNVGDTYLNAASGETLHLRIANSDQLTVVTGTVNVNGTFTAGDKKFKIDHPLDPANKYLYHTSVESSEMMNIYTGNVTTDASGLATVQLPDWFEALNTDFRYQLTAIGQFSQAIVASEISSNQFSIRTDKPNVKVSWQVTGVRHDAYANAHRIPVEVEKAPADRGHYLYPDALGQPASARIGYEAPPPGMQIARRRPVLPRRSTASPTVERMPLSMPALPMPNLQNPILPPPVAPQPPRVAPPPHLAAPTAKPEVTQK